MSDGHSNKVVQAASGTITPMKKSLLLVAHGSRRAASNDEIRALTARLRAGAGARFAAIECAFLELAEPSIPEGIERLIQGGAQEVTVFPYFLAAGRHVSEDIPDAVAGKQAEHGDISIRIAPYLGTAEALPDLLLALIEDNRTATR